MISKFVISTLFLIILLSLPTISPAKFFDDLSEKIEKEAKRTEKRIKKEVDRTDENLDKITQETKVKAKRTWEDHKDKIVPVVVAATVLYVGDINLATLTLKEYGIIKEDGTFEWGVMFSDDDNTSVNSHTVTKHILESVQPGLSKVLESFDPKNANSGL